jgi:hypothetical protein
MQDASAQRSQGGVQFPTGGNCLRAEARERFGFALVGRAKGQQIRCDSGADGHSPDERERDISCMRVPAGIVMDNPLP